MKPDTLTRLLAVAALVLAAACAIVLHSPSIGSQGAQDQGTGTDGEGAITVQGTTHYSGLSVSGNASVGGTLGVAGNATTSGFTIGAAQTIIPVDAKPITPTASIVLLNPAGNTTNTINACVTNGTLLQLTNVATYTVTIADSGNANLTGQLVLGQYDTLSLICVSTIWHELSTSNN